MLMVQACVAKLQYYRLSGANKRPELQLPEL